MVKKNNHDYRLYNKESTKNNDVLKRRDLEDLKYPIYKIFGLALSLIGGIWAVVYNINYPNPLTWPLGDLPSLEGITIGLYIGSGMLAIIGVLFGFRNAKVGSRLCILAGIIPLIYAFFVIVITSFLSEIYYFFLNLSTLFVMGIFYGYLTQPIMILIGGNLVYKYVSHKY